jgi:hypothetical protein
MSWAIRKDPTPSSRSDTATATAGFGGYWEVRPAA